ncbi:Uncharacterised protein g127 [Pycnogonum litorale]
MHLASSHLVILKLLFINNLFEFVHPLENKDVLCEACRAIAAEVDLKLDSAAKRSRTSSSTVMDVICTTENLNKYKFSPPKMSRACKEVLDEHDETFESIVYQLYYGRDDASKRNRKQELVRRMCKDETDLCVNIDDTKQTPVGIKLDSNNEQVKLEMDQDGKLRPNYQKKKSNRKTIDKTEF